MMKKDRKGCRACFVVWVKSREMGKKMKKRRAMSGRERVKIGKGRGL